RQAVGCRARTGTGPKGVILHGGAYQFSTPALTYGPRPRSDFQAPWGHVMASGHLLVIDDSPTVLKVIELALSQAGYAVSTASDDEAGLGRGRGGPTGPDLTLLDRLVPHRDAAEICRRFAADPALQRVPVVVMVARGQGDEIESRFAKASNVVDFIGKPFSPEALQALVSHVVGKRTSRGTLGRDTMSDA